MLFELSSDFFSFIFFIAFMAYTLMAFYLLTSNAKNPLNITISLSFLSFAIWAFGYHKSINALALEDAIFWRRFGAIGWTTTFAFYLHAIFILVKNRLSPLDRLSTFFIYIPAIVCLYIFSISDSLTAKYYNLSLTSLGWQHIGGKPFVYIDIFYAYYALYTILNFHLLLKWRNQSSIYRERTQSLWMIFSLLLIFILSGLRHAVSTWNPEFEFPEVGVIINFFPMFITFYSIVKYKISPISPSNLGDEIISHMNEGLIIFDEKGVVSSVNKTALDILGYNHSELIGKHSSLLFSNYEEKKELFDSAIASHEREKEHSKLTISKSFESTVLSKNQNEIPVLISIAIILDQWGDNLGSSFIFLDLREIKHTQIELKKHTLF